MFLSVQAVTDGQTAVCFDPDVRGVPQVPDLPVQRILIRTVMRHVVRMEQHAPEQSVDRIQPFFLSFRQLQIFIPQEENIRITEKGRPLSCRRKMELPIA